MYEGEMNMVIPARASTCQTLAEDIVRGETSEEDCVINLKEKLRKRSQ